MFQVLSKVGSLALHVCQDGEDIPLKSSLLCLPQRITVSFPRALDAPGTGDEVANKAQLLSSGSLHIQRGRLKKKKKHIHLAAPGLSCSTPDL